MKLTQAQLDEYNETGYVIIECPVVTSQICSS